MITHSFTFKRGFYATQPFSEITDIFHDWDGVYVHYKDFEVFWLTSAKIVIEAGIRACITSVAA